MLGKAQAELSRLILLTRHFFKRLFLNETVFFEEQMAAKVIGIIAILSIFPAFVADALLFKYLLEPEKATAWVEISLFTSLIMLVVGLITLFEWEVIFLERRDYLNLMPLPVKPLTVFSAKFISLVMFVGMFVIGINSLSSFVFAMYLGESRGYGLLSALLLFLTHLLVMLAAGSFIFFVMAFIFGLLNIVIRGKFFQRLSDIIRFALLVGHIFLLYFFLIDTKFIQNWFENLRDLKTMPTPVMMNFPPLWFTGLYQVLLGNRDIFFKTLASRALMALGVAIGAFFLITLVSYSRHLKKLSLERAKHYRPALLKRIFEPVLNLTLLRNPVERAAFWFYGQVITRSRIHRTRLISYLGVGAGFLLILFVSAGKLAWKTQSGNMLSVPLALSFFLLVGIRDATNIPLTYEANWVFQATEISDPWPYFAALRKSIFLFTLVPLYGLLFILYSFIWNLKLAGLHCLYDLAFAVLLMEGLFFNHKKFPFACSYVPGKSKMHVFWLLYLFLFLAYIYIPRWTESYFLASGSRFIIFYAFFILIVSGAWLYHKFYFYPKQGLIYEETPEPSLIELFHAT
jgi:hypothetical protein